MLNDGCEAESFTIFENHAYGPYKDLTFAKNLVNLAPKLMQHVIAFGSLSTRLTIARNLVNLAPELTQHVIAIGSLRTRLTFARNFVNLAPKLIQHVI